MGRGLGAFLASQSCWAFVLLAGGWPVNSQDGQPCTDSLGVLWEAGDGTRDNGALQWWRQGLNWPKAWAGLTPCCSLAPCFFPLRGRWGRCCWSPPGSPLYTACCEHCPRALVAASHPENCSLGECPGSPLLLGLAQGYRPDPPAPVDSSALLFTPWQPGTAGPAPPGPTSCTPSQVSPGDTFSRNQKCWT